MKALLDTHVLIWWFEATERLTPAQRRVLNRANPKSPLLVASISLWEVATLHQLNRISLAVPLRDWLEKAVAPPLVRLLPLTPAIAVETAALPASFHRDPADRILVATARAHRATLLTQDQRIVDSGVVKTL